MTRSAASGLLAACLVTAALSAGTPQVSPGERFFRSGVAADGRPVRATVMGDIDVPSTTMPCLNCHRRSGWGTVEGPVTTPPVVGPVLFEPRTLGNEQVGVRSEGPGTRPAYDSRTLLRAIREGIDASGRRLSTTMPRYVLSDPDGESLVAYLEGLGAAPPAGVTATTVHLATITTPSADPGPREALLAVLSAFAEVKNAGTRNETRRRERGPWDMKSHYELYRQWEIHEWALTGDPRDWPAQLERYHAQTPVFAVVSGVGDGDWLPIHDFCEERRIPCVLPQAALPPERGVEDGFYSLYFSRGLRLESETLANHLRSDRPSSSSREVLQVARCGSAAEGAARRLDAALDPRVPTRCFPAAEPLTPAVWRRILSEADTVVAWLTWTDLAGLEALSAESGGIGSLRRLYLSSTLAGERVAALAPRLRQRAFLVEPYVAPDELERHASRTLVWFKARGLAPAIQSRSAINAFFAASMVADALATPGAIRSREYFVEQIEHMVGRSPLRSAYPALSLGAQRRFASLTCSVLKVPPQPGGAFTPATAAVPAGRGQEVR